MTKALAPAKYFQHPSYALDHNLVNRSVEAAAGFKFSIFAHYMNAQGQGQIAKALNKPTMFTPLALLDDEVARFQIDKALP